MATIQRDILVFAAPSSQDSSRLAGASAAILRLARQLTTGRVAAFGPSTLDSAALTECGASVFLAYDDEAAQRHLAGRNLAGLALGAISQLGASTLGAVLLPSALWSKECAGQLAVTLDGAASTDVSELRGENGSLVTTKSVLGGTWRSTFTLEGPLAVLTLTGEQEAPAPAEVAAVERLSFEAEPLPGAVEIVSYQPSGQEGPSLAEAKVVVCVGRGVGGQMDLPRALAQKLGAALGATRVVCEEGWMPRSAQIGQSGVSVAPDLYIGLGVFGDPYHVCGIRGAKRIVAVVDDPAAPILEIADFGVVGKIEEVLPTLLAELG